MVKIATPISHLFGSAQDAGDIILKSDCLECRDESLDSKFAGQEIFHCHLQPIHELGANDFRYLERVVRLKPDLKLISFHMAASCDNAKIDTNFFEISGGVFQPGGRQFSKDEMLENTRRNFFQIRKILGQDIKIAIENNNYYPTEAYLHITDPSFIRDVVYENDIYLLFDIAHAKVSAHNKKLDYGDYINEFPLERMIQIHICGYDSNEANLAYDAHSPPDEEAWEEIREMISTYPNVGYLTVEYYKDKDILIRNLMQAKEILDGLPRKAFQTE